MDGNSLRSLVLAPQGPACTPGVAFLDSKVEMQGSCLYYAPAHLHSLHTVDGTSLLGHWKLPWQCAEYSEGCSQCLLPCPIQERVRILPVSERPILGIFIFSLRRGGNGCGPAEFTNLLVDDRVLDSLYLGNTIVVRGLQDNCDPTDGVTCPCLPVETRIGTPIQDITFGIFLPTTDKESGPSRLRFSEGPLHSIGWIQHTGMKETSRWLNYSFDKCKKTPALTKVRNKRSPCESCVLLNVTEYLKGCIFGKTPSHIMWSTGVAGVASS